MNFDPRPLLRRARPERWTKAPAQRSEHELPFVTAATTERPHRLMLDTSVLIDNLQGRLPDAVAEIVRRAHIRHSPVVLAEFAFALGRLDPLDPRTRRVRAVYLQVLADVREDRVATPDLEVFVEAGVLNGVLARLIHAEGQQRHRRLNDCLIYLTARKHGLTLLTRDIGDFERIARLAPNGRLLFYRRNAR